jgi:hypothetical protein
MLSVDEHLMVLNVRCHVVASDFVGLELWPISPGVALCRTWGQPQSVALATVSQAVAWKLACSALWLAQLQQNKNYPAALFQPGRFCSAPMVGVTMA